MKNSRRLYGDYSPESERESKKVWLVGLTGLEGLYCICNVIIIQFFININISFSFFSF